MPDIRIVPRTTERKEASHQEVSENRAGALDIIFAYIVQTIGKILFP